MNDIFASIPTNTNQKNTNQNGSEIIKNSPIIIKSNHKSGVISKVISQFPSNSSNVHSIHSHVHQSSASQNDSLESPKNDFKSSNTIQSKFASSNSNEKIEPQENSDSNEDYSNINNGFPDQEEHSKKFSPYEVFFTSLSKKHQTNYLLLLSNAYQTMSNHTTVRTRQSKSNHSQKDHQNSASTSTTITEISDADDEDEIDQERSKKSKKPYEFRPFYSVPLDPGFLENFFLDVRPEDASKTSKLPRRPNIEPYQPQYADWERVGQGYLVNPNPPKLFDEPHFVDFFCQCRLKALVIGGEGTSIYGAKDEQAPLLASNARLQFSMIIDEHGIEQLKVEEEMRNSAAKNTKSAVIDRLAKRRHALESKIREYNDDVRSVYRPPPITLYDFAGITIHHHLKNDNQEQIMKLLNINSLWNISSEYYLPPDFCTVPFDQLHFLLHAIRMIEYTSNLTPKHSTHITKAFTLVFPLILKSVSRPEKEFNFIGHKVHYTFFFRLFRVLNRLIEYFGSLTLIPSHASFGLIPGIRSDITCMTWQKELHKISENIDYGACLSWFLCELRDISIALTLQISNVVMIKEAIKLYDKYEKKHPKRFFYQQNSDDKPISVINYKEKFQQKHKIFVHKGNVASNTKHSQKNTCILSNFTDYIPSENDFFIEDDDHDVDLTSLMKIACRENKGQDLYMMKFFIDNDGMLSFVVKKPNDNEKLRNPIYDRQVSVPPMYPFIMAQTIQVPDDDDLPVYIPEDSTFRFDSAYLTEERFGYSARIDFEPFSTQSHFSLNIPHEC